MKKEGAFTLIEIIVAMGLMLTVGTIAVRVFLALFRGATKAETIKEVKQNGEYALTVMSQMIRNSKEISTCQGDQPQLQLTNQDNNVTTFSLSGDQIASNSNGMTSEYLKASSLNFNCGSAQAGSFDRIRISFSLAKESTNPQEKVNPILFETTVKLRKYF